MTHEAQELLERALKLPPEVRADLATRLLASLDGSESEGHQASVDKTWRDEIVRRVRRILETGEPGIPYAQVAVEMRERLAKKRAARGLS